MNTTETKRYYFTFVSDNEERIYSRNFTRRTIVGLGISLLLVFSLLAFGLSLLLESGYSKYQLITLKQQNQSLKESLESWHVRTENMNRAIETLQKKNTEIRIAAALPAPEIEYGVGGPENEITAYTELPEVNMTELNIERMESEIEQMKFSMFQLEEGIDSRMQQIAHYPSIRPVRGGWLTSGFGKRLDPFTGSYEMHNGIDISVKPGTDVFATAAGRVKKVNKKVISNKGFGKYVIIDHGYGYETLYAHLDKVFVTQGQQVKRWDLIALSGNTGKSTAPHIHYATMKNGKDVDPINFILE